MPSFSLSSSYGTWARAAWESAWFWLWLLPRLTSSKFFPVFSRINYNRECKSRNWFVLCWLSLSFLTNGWIWNTETFFSAYHLYIWSYEICYFVNISLLFLNLSCTTSKHFSSAQGFSQHPLHLHVISAVSVKSKYMNNLGTERNKSTLIFLQ